MTVLEAVPGTLSDVLAARAVRSVFQPIVDLTTSAVVGYEALARGPAGEWESPDRLFAAAAEQGQLGVQDAACRRAAFTAAQMHRLTPPLTVFVNVEPAALAAKVSPAGFAVDQQTAHGLRVVVEFTERALGANPADLLRSVDRVRALGWGVALDDVGAEPLSLAFMSLLRPDVVKLDLRLVHDHPGQQVAQIMHAVNAYAERSGATILAEGIETHRHLEMARALGATLGQGWLFGHPTDHPNPAGPGPGLPPSTRSHQPGSRPVSPFGCLPADVPLRRAPKSLLIEVSKHLEREALRLGPTALVAATFKDAVNVTPATAASYSQLADRAGFVAILGRDLAPGQVPIGVRGVSLDHDDPVSAEWDVVVLDPHFAVALLARDLGDTGPDPDRTFEFALTYHRPTVEDAAHTLITRISDSSGR